MSRALYIILAGGRGERLGSLTRRGPKPLLRIGTRGAVIDYTLFNCLTSGHADVVVLTQHMSEMIAGYLKLYWEQAFGSAGRKLKVLPAQRTSKGVYLGTADAVRQALPMLGELPDHLVVLSADHVYRMDYRTMLDFHASHGKQATIGAVEFPPEQCGRFGVMGVDLDGAVQSFYEKPCDLEGVKTAGHEPLASMGIYVFNTADLVRRLERGARRGWTDFGGHILPAMAVEGHCRAFRFRGPDGKSGYWTDIGDPCSYWEAQMRLLDEALGKRFHEPLPGIGKTPFAAVEMIEAEGNNGKRIRKSLVSRDASVGRARVEHSIIGPGALVEDGAVLENCVLLDGSVVTAGEALTGAVVEPMSVIGNTPLRPWLCSNRPMDKNAELPFSEPGAGMGKGAGLKQLAKG